MKFNDHSPPSIPSPDQQRDALQKGLGRTWQWAVNGRLGEEPLLEACLREQRHDVQVEDSRGNWLWQLILKIGATERFRVPILHALYDLTDDRSVTQLCELGRCYAETGDETFRARLYETVEQASLAEAEIIALDGEPAFLFAARVRGQQLVTREWEWHDGSLLFLAIERFGEDHVNRLLDSSSDAAVCRFRKGWRRGKQIEAEERSRASQESTVAISVDEIYRTAESESESCLFFRRWARHADEADLRTVLRRLWSEREPRVIAKLLRVFAARALPEFDVRLLELCRHADAEVRRAAFGALEENTDPRVREFGLIQLQKEAGDRFVVSPFVNNYQPGDERRILEALEFPGDVDERHWLLMDVIELLEKNPTADVSPLAVIAYASTPCENCRYRAVRLLQNQHAAPAWLEEECRYDSNEQCRKLVEVPTESSPTS